jgi:isoleucyl-tRNA synthetase
VALDVTISEDLRKEGVARELVNRIQNLRKDSGFDVTDRIDVQLQKDDLIVASILQNEAYIKSETLAENLEIVNTLNDGINIVFDGISSKLFIKKH